MTNSKSSGDNGFESSDGWEVEDEVEIPNGNGEADNNNMEANFEAICDTARYVLLSTRFNVKNFLLHPCFILYKEFCQNTQVIFVILWLIHFSG